MLNKILRNALLNYTKLDKYSNFYKKQSEIKDLQNKLNIFNQEKKNIQSKFDFNIPDYLIDEIIESHSNKIYNNLQYLINCAIINGKISKENGYMLKKVYYL